MQMMLSMVLLLLDYRIRWVQTHAAWSAKPPVFAKRHKYFAGPTRSRTNVGASLVEPCPTCLLGRGRTGPLSAQGSAGYRKVDWTGNILVAHRVET